MNEDTFIIEWNKEKEVYFGWIEGCNLNPLSAETEEEVRSQLEEMIRYLERTETQLIEHRFV